MRTTRHGGLGHWRAAAARVLGVACAMAASAAPALAISLGAAEAQATVTTEFVEGRFQARHNGELLFNAREDLGAGGVRPEITVTNTPDGFDLELFFKNTSSEPTVMGHLEFGAFTVDGPLFMRRFKHESSESAIELRDGGPRLFGTHYPSDAYSPVMTLRDDSRTIGVTAQFPVLDYQHGVRLTMRATDQALGGHKWTLLVEWHRMIKDSFAPARFVTTVMQPGEERTVNFSFRVADDHDDWIDTLTPYVEYFQETHGGVTYQPDHRAVRGFHAAGVNLQSPSNPRGFGYGQRRADIHGWRGWADEIADVRRSGFQRVMIWAPTGMMLDEDFNYPFLFATPLMGMKPAADTIGFLRGLAPRGVELGFWWGRSQQVMYGWDDPRTEIFDPNNEDHVQRALAELDAAARMGVRTIGLDAYAYLNDWEAIPWLMRMRERHPRMKFVTEASSSDLLHRHAPTWIDNPNALTRCHLADAIFPGHETWVGVRFDLVEDLYGGGPLNETQKLLEIQRVANLGYVPIVQDENITIPTGLGARGPSTGSSQPIMTRAPTR